MSEAALERVRRMAESWTTMEGDGFGVALDRRIGDAVLDAVRDDGSPAEFRVARIKRLAEGWLTPGNLLYYPAAGQCVLDAINRDGAAAASPVSVTKGDTIRIIPERGPERVMLVTHVEHHIITLADLPA